MLGAMKQTLLHYRVEFMDGVKTVHQYEVRAADGREALVMARTDLPSMKERYGATGYRVFDLVSLTYLPNSPREGSHTQGS
jgi:hypothetical protein